MRQIPVRRMIAEKFFLLAERLLHWQASINILLTSIHDADKSKLERVRPSRQDIQRVRACIHQVELCQDADRA